MRKIILLFLLAFAPAYADTPWWMNTFSEIYFDEDSFHMKLQSYGTRYTVSVPSEEFYYKTKGTEYEEVLEFKPNTRTDLHVDGTRYWMQVRNVALDGNRYAIMRERQIRESDVLWTFYAFIKDGSKAVRLESAEAKRLYDLKFEGEPAESPYMKYEREMAKHDADAGRSPSPQKMGEEMNVAVASSSPALDPKQSATQPLREPVPTATANPPSSLLAQQGSMTGSRAGIILVCGVAALLVFALLRRILRKAK